MFDIGAIEMLVVVVVAIIVIGPKDMPQALRHAGRWVGKIRRASAQFRSGFDAMVREAEMEDMEKKWKDKNAQIMAKTGGNLEMMPLSAKGATAEDAVADRPTAGDAVTPPGDDTSDTSKPPDTIAEEPMLPLDKNSGR